MDRHKQAADDTVNMVVTSIDSVGDAKFRALAAGAMLDAVPTLQRGLRQLRQEAVLELRREGLSHAEVAKELGISRARAQQIAEGKTSGKRQESKVAEA